MPSVVHDVEFGIAEGRRHLVLNHARPDPAADGLVRLLDRAGAADVEADRGVELQRPAARRGLGRAEHHADLLTDLVDEDDGAVGALGDRAGELPHRLAHQAGLQADVAVAHLAFDLGARDQRRHGVDHDDVHRVGPNQQLADLQRLLAGVGLRDKQFVDVHAKPTWPTTGPARARRR